MAEDRRPKHVAIIMDGNGRWAQSQGLERIEGHLRGVETVRKVMEACSDFGVQALTLYCFSSENWKRPPTELEFLMELLKRYLVAERETLVENNLRVRVIGRREGLPEDVLEEIDETLRACANNDGMTLCLAINYGSRQELIDAVRSLVNDVRDGELTPEEIDEANFESKLYTAGIPDPDLLIRTSGEMRISNFLLWQISYSELWVTDTPWPEFDRTHLAEAIRCFANRNRRFGGLNASKE
ncbi:MAG: isoprenyl transferase [Pirellulaceae bacterium]